MSVQKLFSQTLGEGQNVVLLHGWGVNSGVWDNVVSEISQYYRVTVIDLPGFGRSNKTFPTDYSLENISQLVAPYIPAESTLLGWSLGGLVANYIAIKQLVPLKALVLVASSPKFVSGENWYGINPAVLQMFQEQLQDDFSKTLERFLAIQTIGSEYAKKDIQSLKLAIEKHPMPAKQALACGLILLESVDLRAQLMRIDIPVLCAFGKLDTLVPSKAHTAIKNLYSNCKEHVYLKASHAPFISHQQEFVQMLRDFITEA